jgi:hypothetical protein
MRPLLLSLALAASSCAPPAHAQVDELPASQCTAAAPRSELAHPFDAFEPAGTSVILAPGARPPRPIDPPGTAWIRVMRANVRGAHEMPPGASVVRFSALRPCYAQARERRPDLAGAIHVRFTVAPEGTIAESGITIEDELAYPPLRACLARRIACTRFPRADAPTEFDLQLALGVEPR